MKWWVLLIFVMTVGVGGWWYTRSSAVISPLGNHKDLPAPKPLDRYTIAALQTRAAAGGPIVLGSPVATTSGYTEYPFSFTSEHKKVTGLAHLPSGVSAIHKAPVIIQLRGYIDPERYMTGDGTRRSAEYYANAGFISLAPDFLGYGGSDKPNGDIFAERFQTYTTALDLIAAIKTLSVADENKIGVWGHSNGGHIALTILEILGTKIPSVLWAPVTKYFPYSILYYTDEAPDGGKLLRSRLAEFENKYDAGEYSFTNYLDLLAGPMQIHQGGNDEAVPKVWTDSFISKLEKLNKDVSYYVYPGVDHNLSPVTIGWNTAVERDVSFFRKWLQ